MKKSLIAMMLVLLMAGSALALPMTQQEVFLGGDKSLYLSQGDAAVFSFDFVNKNKAPTTDAFGFIQGSDILSAILGVTISSSDFLPERIVISSAAGDGGKKLLDQTLFLGGGLPWCDFNLASKTFKIDLLTAGLEKFLEDGKFQVSVLAGRLPGNDFNLDEVSMRMTSAAPVPEPGTMVLLSGGILGLAVLGKRRQKNADLVS